MKRVVQLTLKGHVLVTASFSSRGPGSPSATSPKQSPPPAAAAAGGLTDSDGATPAPLRATRSRLLGDLAASSAAAGAAASGRGSIRCETAACRAN